MFFLYSTRDSPITKSGSPSCHHTTERDLTLSHTRVQRHFKITLNNTGFGSDILTTLHYYVIGDPLTLLSVFFKSSQNAVHSCWKPWLECKREPRPIRVLQPTWSDHSTLAAGRSYSTIVVLVAKERDFSRVRTTCRTGKWSYVVSEVKRLSFQSSLCTHRNVELCERVYSAF